MFEAYIEFMKMYCDMTDEKIFEDALDEYLILANICGERFCAFVLNTAMDGEHYE